MAEQRIVTTAMAAQDLNLEHLLGRNNVVGVGTGYRVKKGKLTDEICVQILVSRKQLPDELAAHDLIPARLDSPEGRRVSTDVLEVGPIDAYQDRGRYRPVPAGVSIGPEARVSAGTLGGWACDDTDDDIVLLSNNHVISNLDTMPALRRIVQPGRFDFGVLPADIIGVLKRHIAVNTVPNVVGANPPASVVDAAIGTIDVDYTLNLRQLNVPVIFEIQSPTIGLNVQKRGRTTRLTTNGRITTINVTQLITYRNRTRLGRIQNAFIISSTDGNPFSAAGDSGSLILDQAEGELEGTFPVVGLLFGGGADQFGNPITIANDINAVFGALNLSTACTCIARAIIRAIFGAELREGRDIRFFLRHKERQLRRFRERLADAGTFGKAMEHVIRTQTAKVGQLLAEDDEAFGHLVRALRPLVRQATTYDVLETRLDREMLDNLLAFGSRVSRRSRGLRPRVAVARGVLKAVEGLTVGQVLRSAELSLGEDIPGGRPRRRRGGRKRR